MAKSLGVTEFRKTCLRVIRQLEKDGEPVTITHRGRPVAVLAPVPLSGGRSSIIGAMRGSVLDYDRPFAPATDPSDWATAR